MLRHTGSRGALLRTLIAIGTFLLMLSGCGQTATQPSATESKTPTAKMHFVFPTPTPGGYGYELTDISGTGPASLPVDAHFAPPTTGGGVHMFTLRLECSGQAPVLVRDAQGRKIFGIMRTAGATSCTAGDVYTATGAGSSADRMLRIDTPATTNWELQVWVR